MICGKCKHLGKEVIIEDWDSKEYREIPTGFYQCKLIEHMGRDCGDDMKAMNTPGCRAYVEDGSGYYAALKVKTDFGCVCWEPRETKWINEHPGGDGDA